MVHLEWLEATFPTLRISRHMIRKASARIESAVEFSASSVSWSSWVDSWLIKAKFLKLAELRTDERFRADEHACLTRWVGDMLNRLFVLVRYIRSGERTFQLSYALTQALAATSNSTFKLDDFKLPFPGAVYVEFPEGAFRLEGVVNPVYVAGCYLLDMRSENGEFCVQPILSGLHADPCFGFSQMCSLRPGPDGELWSDPRPSTLSVNLKTFSDAEPDEARGPEDKEIRYVSEEMAAFWGTIVKVAVNAMLYATSATPDVIEEAALWREVQDDYRRATGKRKRKLEEQLGKMPRTQRTILGKNITLRRGVPEGSDVPPPEPASGVLTKPQLVLGHFKPRLSEKLGRPVWVAPYVRGPGDLAEIIKRTYRMS